MSKNHHDDIICVAVRKIDGKEYSLYYDHRNRQSFLITPKHGVSRFIKHVLPEKYSDWFKHQLKEYLKKPENLRIYKMTVRENTIGPLTFYISENLYNDDNLLDKIQNHFKGSALTFSSSKCVSKDAMIYTDAEELLDNIVKKEDIL